MAHHTVPLVRACFEHLAGRSMQVPLARCPGPAFAYERTAVCLSLASTDTRHLKTGLWILEDDDASPALLACARASCATIVPTYLHKWCRVPPVCHLLSRSRWLSLCRVSLRSWSSVTLLRQVQLLGNHGGGTQKRRARRELSLQRAGCVRALGLICCNWEAMRRMRWWGPRLALGPWRCITLVCFSPFS